MLAIADDDYMWFVDQALDGMTSIVRGLGDEIANRRPPLEGANTPFAILTHCLGVMEYWGGYMVAGRSIERDRASEFRSKGAVEDLIERTSQARSRLLDALAAAEPASLPRGEPNPADAGLPFARSQGAVLFHIYEELAQHLGQMELTRDVLLAKA